MRPLTLTLEGFQGYLEPETIDLTSITSAAITGRVGSGKSSILDGIVYALYGVTRTPTKEGVIHTHAKSLRVELDFELGEGVYRIKRTRTVNGNPKTYLWKVEEDGELTTLGNGSGNVKESDRAVRELFPVSLSAFRASVLVEQGKSDSFVGAAPAARYALMQEVLNLGVYQEIHEKAKKKVKEYKGQLAYLDQVLAGEQDLKEKAEQAQTAVQDAAGEKERAGEQVQTATGAEQAAAQAVQAAEQALASAQEANAEGAEAVNEAKAELVKAQNSLASLEAEVAATTRRVEDGTAWVAAQQQQITETMNGLQARLETVRASLPADGSNWAQQAQALEAQHAQAYGQATTAGQNLETIRGSLAALTQQATEHTHARQALMGQWREEKARLDALTSHQHQSTCHACGQLVDDVTAQRMITDLQGRLSAIEQEGKTHATALQQLTGQVASGQAQLEDAQQHLTQAQGQVQQLATQLAEARTRAATAQAAAAEVQSITAQLDTYQQGTSSAHQQLATHTQTLTTLEAQLAELETQLVNATQAVRAAELDLADTQAKHQLTDLEPLQQALTGARTSQAQTQSALTEAKVALARAEATEAATQKEATEAAGALDALKDTAAERKKTRAALTVEQHTVEMSAPTGAPQMIMNSALETMNTHLHNYLAEISGNVLTAALSTTVEKKDGSSKNQLNIQVTGADGNPRPYETFSGGQKFLTDFALHLTFAKLLTEQGGVPVDFFAVDEGWNSLEGEEKTAVLRAVQAMGDHYAQVLTVTHDEDVINAMPQQIKVEMTGGTSTVAVSP